MQTYDTTGCSRTNLQMILNLLDSKDINYDFNGNKDRITFDITELSEKFQNIIEKCFKPIKESKLESFIRKIVKEERQQRMKEVDYSPLTRNLYNKLRKYQDKISSKGFDNLLLKYNINPDDYYAGNLSDKVDPITKNPKLKFKESSLSDEFPDLIPTFKKLRDLSSDLMDLSRSRGTNGQRGLNQKINSIRIQFNKLSKTLEPYGLSAYYDSYSGLKFKKIKSEYRINESSQQEIEDIAIDLIDYLGGQLPTQGYTRNQRIMDYFRELGYKDNDPMIHKIYNLALKLNR